MSTDSGMHWPSRPASDHSLVSAAQTDSATGRAAMNNDLQSLKCVTNLKATLELIGMQGAPVALSHKATGPVDH